MIGPALSVVGGMTSLNRMILEEEIEGVSIKFVASMDKRSLFGRLNRWVWNLISAPIFRFFDKPDIVHIHVSSGLSIWRKTSIGNFWIALGVPVIYHTHGSKARDFIEGSSRLVKFIIRRRFRKATRIVTLSEGWRNWYSENLSIDIDAITILPTPIHIEKKSNNDGKESKDVLYSGLMGKRKGTFDLIEAWSRIQSEGVTGCNLHLIGDGMVKECKNLVRNLNLEDTCIVHGWVSEEKKKELLGTCGIYSLPSHNEGLPMGLLEAMAHGLAPVSTTVGGIPEVISDRENGFLTEPGDIEELSRILKELIVNDDLREQIASKARNTAEEHDWEKYCPKLLHLWKEVTGGKTAS